MTGPRRAGTVATLMLAACAVLAAGALGASSRPLTPLVVDFNPLLLSSAPVAIGIEEGFFSTEGIDVRPINLRQAIQAFPALLTGQVDVYTGSYASGFVAAVLQGGKLRAVADKGHTGPGSGGVAFMIRQDLIDSGRYRTLRDLRGLRIGIASRGGVHEFLLTQILRNRAILTPADVTVQQINSAFLADAFRAKALDAATVTDPVPARLEILGLARTVVTLHDVLPSATMSIIVYGPNLLSRNPGLAQRFMNAFLRGVHQYNAGRTARNIAIIRKYTTEEEEVLRRIPWTLINADGRLNVDSMIQMQRWWVREGWLERTLPAEQFIDMSYARQAYRLVSRQR